jgi:5-methyltetrahydrofolate--homocysteine methyltransferase
MYSKEQLDALAEQRILVLDGAMGSLIQQYGLRESDFRGDRFASHPADLAGCTEVLCLTKPAVVDAVHTAYLEAGADIISTCSFANGTAVTLADYGLSDLAYEISREAAAIARRAADRFSSAEKPRFVAGSMGPLTKSASLSPDIRDPGKRGIYWDEMAGAYYDNARGLADGGADILLIETVFDTLNAKAALFAVSRLEEERGAAFPLMISASISDAAGRLLSGQTVEAFCASVLHSKPWSVGLNCSLGADSLKKHIKALAGFAPCLVSAHPNAGMPNEFGVYNDTPQRMAALLETYMQEGLLNVAGGCCGSTPAHIKAIAGKASRYPPRRRPKTRRRTLFAGLEVAEAGGAAGGLVKIGERTNVAGSRQFLRLIQQEQYREALAIAREMLEKGAGLINVCMDDPMLDAQAALSRFLTLALSDPDIARAPVMLDSSRWEVIETGLKLLQGKGIVNSISLKDGEEEFLRKARLARRYGAAVMVMLFDEQGQAAVFSRKTEAASRAYRLLTEDGFPPEDIIFDAVVLTIATGIPEHDVYGRDFIDACRWIKANCPYAQVSGGIANLSFSFQGSGQVRDAMHSVILKHAMDAGLSMAIVNPAAMLPYDTLDTALRDAAEDLILCRKQGAAEALLALALKSGGAAASRPVRTESGGGGSWRSLPLEERIHRAVVSGIDDYIEQDVLELRPLRSSSLEIVEGPLMGGMREVGDRFGAGEMFLPQVIRSARVMQRAVSALSPFIEAEKAGASRGKRDKILLATVKGDVHDIGKNFVAVVLGCNGYEVLDLGVMAPAERIIEAALAEKAALIGLSGLITPSLDEMIKTAKALEARGLAIPLMIGGATTSLAHTALRIAPAYSAPVVYVRDASRSAEVARALLSSKDRPGFLQDLARSYQDAAARHAEIEGRRRLIPLAAARENKAVIDWSHPEANPPPRSAGIQDLRGYPLERVAPYIDWPAFLRQWESKQEDPRLLEDAKALLSRIVQEKLFSLRGVAGILPARAQGDDVVIYHDNHEAGEEGEERLCFLRDQRQKPAGRHNLCLADFVMPQTCGSGWIGLFALGVFSEGAGAGAEDEYHRLLAGTLAHTLAEAFSAEVHKRVQREWWGIEGGIRPAIGYPMCPDHKDKEVLFKALNARERCGFDLTEHGMIIPAASVCGLYLAHPRSCYFGVGTVGEDQLRDWTRRKGISLEEGEKRLTAL